MDLKEAYSKNFKEVFSLIYSLVDEVNDSLDILVDVMKALSRTTNLESPEEIKTFLLITARNYTLNFLKHKKDASVS